MKKSPLEFYEEQAKKLIALEREDRGLTHEQVFERLKAHGWTASEHQILITKLARGKFTFAFALQVLAALGVEKFEVPNYYGSPAKAPKPDKG